MSVCQKLLSKFSLSYQNRTEETEYAKLKRPLIKSLCIWLFVFTALLFVPLTYRYISKDLYPQTYLGISFLVLAVLIFIFRHKLQKYLEIMTVIYLAMMLGLYTANMKLILEFQKPYEAFYMGYGFALTQRMLDFRVSKFPIFIIFNFLFVVIKFSIITIPEGGLAGLIVCLEVFPMIISFKVEKAERALFDSFHKSKCQLQKFKDFLTDHFPNQLAVIAQDFSNMYFINNPFMNLFKCENFSQLKSSLEKLDISNESIDQNREIYALIKQRISNDNETNKPLSLSHFLSLISNKIKEISNSKPIVLQVYQNEDKERESLQSNNDCSTKRNFCTQTREYSDSLLIRDNTNALSERNKMNKQSIFKKTIIETKNTLQENDRNIKNDALVIEENCEQKDQQIRPNRSVWKVTIFPLLWEDNDSIAIILDDITYEKTILELEIADKNKDLVITMVSHELRTPLNGMLGMVDMVKKQLKLLDIDKESEVFYYLDAFRINSQFLLNLVNSILDFSQFRSNKLTLDYSQVNIHSLLEKIRPLFDHICKSKNLFLDIQISQDVPGTIVTDQGRLTQILINLIGNAFKFTFIGGVTVGIVLEQQNPCRISISVQDTGIGIKKEDMDKLFQLFGRLDQHKDINTQGVGLGLILSSSLAILLDPNNKNKGIEVMSELEKGSMFRFTVESKSLTLVSENAESSINEQQEESVFVQDKINFYTQEIISDKKAMKAPHLTKERASIREAPRTVSETEAQDWCLLVDDNTFNLMVAEHLMQNRGYKIKKALNGKQAIERVQEHEREGFVFGIILMDCEMPVMNGYEATKILTSMMKKREIHECPVIAVTANMNDERHKKLCDEVGMSGYIAKPLHIDKVEQILRPFHRKYHKQVTLKDDPERQ